MINTNPLRHVLAAAVLACKSVVGTLPLHAETEAELAARAAALHARIFTIDTHLDTTWSSMCRPGWDVSQRHDVATDFSQCDFPRMREDGLDAGFFAFFLEQGPRDEKSLAAARNRTLRYLTHARETVARHATACELALTADDALRIAATGKRAVFLSIENSYAIGTDLSLLETYHQLGVRMIGPVHSKHNGLGDSSGETKSEWNGLSPLGRAFVQECNRLGVVLDGSHAADSALRHLLELSAAPVLLSHSGCKAVFKHPRNVDDDLLRALAAKGGVIQMVAIPQFLRAVDQTAFNAATTRLLARYAGRTLNDAEFAIAEREWQALVREHLMPQATLDDFLKHLFHALDVIGPNHVGIGCDFDGGGGVRGLEDVSDYPKITLALLKRGLSEADVEKIWGGNTLRVLRAAEEHAKSGRQPGAPAKS